MGRPRPTSEFAGRYAAAISESMMRIIAPTKMDSLSATFPGECGWNRPTERPPSPAGALFGVD
jgi:hypothetical protein